MTLYEEELNKHHQFVTEQQALDMLTKQSLVIAVDHHTVDLSASEELLKKAKRTLVIDHHRRRKDDNIKASMLYLEASASSAVELVTELMQYQPDEIELCEEEANIMLAGIIVDTNHFTNRTGQRTFEAAGILKDWGADTQKIADLLKNDFTDFEIHNKMVSYAQIVMDKYAIAPVVSDDYYSRVDLSKTADSLLNIAGVEASFVIAYLDADTAAISARSAGKVNVQVIMEAMNGGGHFTGAALQRTSTSVEELTNELVDILRDYERKNEEQ